MDTNKLLKSLENESNEYLLNKTSNQIIETNYIVLQELVLEKKELLKFMNLLKGYRYIDDMSELKYGTYIRWIPIMNPREIKMVKGALFCDIKITDNGVYLICKSFHNKNCKHFQIKLDECLVFQKLTEQEKMILSVMDHLSLGGGGQLTPNNI
jgi:hypothetical protein